MPHAVVCFPGPVEETVNTPPTLVVVEHGTTHIPGLLLGSGMGLSMKYSGRGLSHKYNIKDQLTEQQLA